MASRLVAKLSQYCGRRFPNGWLRLKTSQHCLPFIVINFPINDVTDLIESPDDFHDQIFIECIILDIDRVRSASATATRDVTTPDK